MGSHTTDTPDRTARAETPVTRIEVIDHIGGAFTGAVLSRDDLLAVAGQAGARPAVLQVLAELPDRRFHRPQDLWADLPEVPIDH